MWCLAGLNECVRGVRVDPEGVCEGCVCEGCLAGLSECVTGARVDPEVVCEGCSGRLGGW